MVTLVPALSRHGRAAHAHTRATRHVVDDFGNAVGFQRRCPLCVVWQPLDDDHFGPDMAAYGFQRQCRLCERESRRRRFRTDPEVRARAREYDRVRYASDPDYRRQRRERERRWVERQRTENADAYNAKRRAYYAAREARIAADPALRLERLENERIDQAIMRRAAGAREVRELRRIDAVARESGGKLPSAPIAAAVLAEIERRKRDDDGERPDEMSNSSRAFVCELLGFSERTLWAWETGERPRAYFDVVDRILIALDRLWWEVYDADRWPEEHEQARRLFEGQPETSAQAG